MSAPLLATSTRIRRTPFSQRVDAAEPKSTTVYNHTPLVAVYRSLEEDYHHLKRAVQIWDVSCERQVELRGPDAARLIQMTTPRDLSAMGDDQCYYVPAVDAQGGLLNDPVAVRLAADRFWVSLADTDLLLYYKGLADALKLDVAVFEPDVSPLAIQGPKADDLAARIWGDEVRSLKFFRHMRADVGGTPMVLARSGWSKQGGFELYLDGAHNGPAIWDQLMEAGRDLDVHAGCPNLIERIEGGLLSFGGDIKIGETPYEAGLQRFMKSVSPTCLAAEALEKKSNPTKQIRPLSISGDAVPAVTEEWSLSLNGESVGEVRAAAWSPDFNTNVAIAMVGRDAWDAGTEVSVTTPSGTRTAKVEPGFWI